MIKCCKEGKVEDFTQQDKGYTDYCGLEAGAFTRLRA